MNIFRCIAIAFLILCTTVVNAIDYKPWYGRIFEIDASADILMQGFTHVDTKHGSGKHSEFDAFIDLSASMEVWDGIAAQLEVIAAQTREHHFNMDAIRLTGKYQWLNDIIGDPVSLSTGLTLSTIFPACRRNLATFDHGGIGCEGHIAVGREVSCMQFWTSRLWGVFAMGIADVGSPWLRANFAWEHNWWDRHRLELAADTIWGLGRNGLDLHHFHGYGPVQYQAVDLALRYNYQFDCGLVLGAGYGYRVYARYAPENVNFVMLRIMYPFGL